MKKLLLPFLAILFLASCGMESMNDMQPDQEITAEDLLSEGIDTDMLNTNMRLAPAGSCDDDCIEPGGSVFYPVSDMAMLSVGRNTKSVSYSAYNTETDFVVEVTYAITAGPANARATIRIAIDGNEVEYTDVSSGSTVSHTVALADGWAGCDQVAFSVVQEGLGTPITFSESYALIPVCAEESLEIGDTYQGGIIAYILQPGDPGYVAGETHGIIAAQSDQSSAIQWWNGSFTTTGATGTALGTGQANTTAIVANQGAGSYAASICAAYSVTVGATTYNDWYLPSKDELDKLYLNRVAVGGFASAFYWSSSEFDINYAWFQNFTNGFQSLNGKNFTNRVRAVRAF
ncbi:DUF1566 domain-containing protein [Cyclobacteriaceae bacterium YHN15]|nr:DUF1566 domain-containing protein [Cyclobacteriaceae bacterium YHN15]